MALKMKFKRRVGFVRLNKNGPFGERTWFIPKLAGKKQYQWSLVLSHDQESSRLYKTF